MTSGTQLIAALTTHFRKNRTAGQPIVFVAQVGNGTVAFTATDVNAGKDWTEVKLRRVVQ